jgi:Thrombospondin type 3 repeat
MQIQYHQKTVDLISPTRFHRHLVAAAAVAMGAAAANAGVVYSGVVNFACAIDIDGCYINVETNTLTNGPGAGAPGWDVNPYRASTGSGMNFFGSTGGGMVSAAAGTGSAINLAAGTPIGASSNFSSSTATVVFGSAAGNWQYGTYNIVGFRFLSSAGTTHYGWMRFLIGSQPATGNLVTRTVVDYAYESTPGVQIGWEYCNTDTDLDGRPDCNDNCINIANSNQLNTDGDTRGDACDNCPLIANSSQADCNNNSIGNACEIAAGAPDYNQDTIPDTCQCLADLVVNHEVNGADLGALLAAWGPVNPAVPSADINRDGSVDGADLGYLLYAWGPCTN